MRVDLGGTNSPDCAELALHKGKAGSAYSVDYTPPLSGLTSRTQLHRRHCSCSNCSSLRQCAAHALAPLFRRTRYSCSLGLVAALLSIIHTESAGALPAAASPKLHSSTAAAVNRDWSQRRTGSGLLAGHSSRAGFGPFHLFAAKQKVVDMRFLMGSSCAYRAEAKLLLLSMLSRKERDRTGRTQQQPRIGGSLPRTGGSLDIQFFILFLQFTNTR